MANINQRYFLMKISTLNKQKGKVFFCCAPVASLLPDHLQPSSLVTVAASIKSPNQFDKSLISGAVSHCYKFIGLEPISPRLPPHCPALTRLTTSTGAELLLSSHGETTDCDVNTTPPSP